MGKSLNYPVEGKSIYFLTEKQLGEFLRQAGQDAEKREAEEAKMKAIVFKSDAPAGPKRDPKRKRAGRKLGDTVSTDYKYVGQTFGALRVIRFSHRENGRRMFLCHCDRCGSDVYRSNKGLSSVKSCGCGSFKRKG